MYEKEKRNTRRYRKSFGFSILFVSESIVNNFDLFILNTGLLIVVFLFNLTNLLKGCIIHYTLLFSLFFTYKKLPKFVEVRDKYKKKKSEKNGK